MWRSMKRGIWTDEERDKGGDSGETGTEDNAGVKSRKMRKKGREVTEDTYCTVGAVLVFVLVIVLLMTNIC